jgi:hypothetical protein
MRNEIPDELDLFGEVIPLSSSKTKPKEMEEDAPEEESGDETFYTDNYNTDLSPQAEKKFQEWAKGQSKIKGRDLLKDLEDYDLRGFWKAGAHADEKSGHLSDEFKKPNHPTFSEESKYSGMLAPHGGNYMGGKWSKDDENKDTFTPSKHMMANTHNADTLKEYMAEREPTTILVLPDTGDMKDEEDMPVDMDMDMDMEEEDMPRAKSRMKKVPVTQITIIGKKPMGDEDF